MSSLKSGALGHAATQQTPSIGAGSKTALPDIFHASFSEAEQRSLLSEDLEAQTGVCLVLGALIASGMMLGILSVILILWLRV